jgi:hypothetical protein
MTHAGPRWATSRLTRGCTTVVCPSHPTTQHLNGPHIYLPRVIKKREKTVHRDKALYEHRVVQKRSKAANVIKKGSARAMHCQETTRSKSNPRRCNVIQKR